MRAPASAVSSEGDLCVCVCVHTAYVSIRLRLLALCRLKATCVCVCVCVHTAYVSNRQHTSTSASAVSSEGDLCVHTARQHTSAYVSIRLRIEVHQYACALGNRVYTAYVRCAYGIRQVCIRHTSAYVYVYTSTYVQRGISMRAP